MNMNIFRYLKLYTIFFLVFEILTNQIDIIDIICLMSIIILNDLVREYNF